MALQGRSRPIGIGSMRSQQSVDSSHEFGSANALEVIGSGTNTYLGMPLDSQARIDASTSPNLVDRNKSPSDGGIAVTMAPV